MIGASEPSLARRLPPAGRDQGWPGRLRRRAGPAQECV